MLAPSIDDLAALLREERTEQVSGIVVRRAQASDIEGICALLHRSSLDHGFEPPSENDLSPLFDYEWLHEKPDYGFILVHEKEIVGFLGTIYARRQINGKDGIVCNFASWYVRPRYRGWGAALLNVAIRDDVTYTTLTPNLLSRRALKMLGFSTLVDSRLVLPPLLHADTLRREPPEIVCDPASVRLLLTDLQRRVFDDHAPYCLQLVVREDHEQGYVVVKRRTAGVPKIWRLLPSSIRIPYSDVLYCSNPSLVVRHLERIKLTDLSPGNSSKFE